MMRFALLSFYHFISSVRFTLILLFLSILLVTVGTFYEGHTRSHTEALTLYRHPIFASLLGGYFLNILTSALRRWPFKKHHIGFLITHLGLLMILAGQALKIEKGVQGHLLLQEGTEKDSYIDSEKVLLEVFKDSTDSGVSHSWVFDSSWGHFQSRKLHCLLDKSNLSLDIQPLNHGKRELYCFWFGLGKWQIENELSSQELLQLPNHVFTGSNHLKNIKETFEKAICIYFEDQQVPLNGQELTLQGISIRATLETSNTALLPQSILINIDHLGEKASLSTESWRYFLNARLDHPWKCETDPLKTSPEGIFLKANPFLGLYQTLSTGKEDSEHQISGGFEHLFYLNEQGRWQESTHAAEASTQLLILKNGYGAWAEFVEDDSTLQWSSKVLPYLDQDCFSKTGIDEIYQEWSSKGGLGLLKTQSRSFKPFIKWAQLSSEQKTALWLLHQLTQGVDWSNETGLWKHLQDRLWPLASELKNVDPDFLQKHPTVHPNIWRLAQLIFQIKTLAPLVQTQVMPLLSEEGSFFESYPVYTQTLAWTLEGLHPCLLTLFEEHSPKKKLHLVSKASRYFTSSPGSEPDKELSTFNIEFREGEYKELLEIPVEKLDRGLAWPIFDGKYWIKASHPSYPIGYQIRLHRAFAEFYPGSLTPQNYHSEVSWKKTENDPSIYTNISMNKVMQLPCGYRFYLSSITPLQPTSARTALFTVNYDPYKNVLTYPGTLLVCLGSLILLIRKRAYVQQLFR